MTWMQCWAIDLPRDPDKANLCAPGNAKGMSLSGCTDDCRNFWIGESTMSQRTWFITGVSSGFGRQLTDQLLERGDSVVGTVRLEQIQFLLGHVSIQTTERYLGCKQRSGMRLTITSAWSRRRPRERRCGGILLAADFTVPIRPTSSKPVCGPASHCFRIGDGTPTIVPSAGGRSRLLQLDTDGRCLTRPLPRSPIAALVSTIRSVSEGARRFIVRLAVTKVPT